MIALTINLNGDGVLKDWPQEKLIIADSGMTVTTLEGGTQSGLPSVAVIIDLPDGKKVFAETSARLFLSAARAIEARYGDLLTPNKG